MWLIAEKIKATKKWETISQNNFFRLLKRKTLKSQKQKIVDSLKFGKGFSFSSSSTFLGRERGERERGGERGEGEEREREGEREGERERGLF